MPNRSAADMVNGASDGGLFAYPDLRTLLAEHGRWGWLDEAPQSDQQHYFQHW